MSLAAGTILGISGVKLAQIFAWIGVGVTVVMFGKLTTIVVEINDRKEDDN